MVTWSPQQDGALKYVDRWFYHESKQKQICRVFGYAGTGKTTLARHFAENIDGDVVYGAFTGKAALMMQRNGCIGARTIHSLMYIADVDKKTGEVTFRLNRSNSPLMDAALIVIDECSMVDEGIAFDLMSFKKPILVLGDPGQLGPPKGAGYFTDAVPDVMLTEIHRQSGDNPIIHLATMLRNGEYPEIGAYGSSRVVSKISSTDATNADQILVGRNVTKDNMNRRMRKILGMDPDTPVKNDRLICLKNDHDKGIFNGGMFNLNRVLEKQSTSTVLSMQLDHLDTPDALPVLVKVHKSFFFDNVPTPDWRKLKGTCEFDYGYAITCHKSQGSQWDNVLIYDESWCFRDDWHRWLYTAVTRGAESITLLKS